MNMKIALSILAILIAAGVALIFLLMPSADEQRDHAMRQMAWCHDLGGIYSNKIDKGDRDGAPLFDKSRGTCEVPPEWSLPADCYTTKDADPAGAPIGVNWYAYYLLDKGGGGAGGLDEYEHCAKFPVVRPSDTGMWIGPKSVGWWSTRPAAAP